MFHHVGVFSCKWEPLPSASWGIFSTRESIPASFSWAFDFAFVGHVGPVGKKSHAFMHGFVDFAWFLRSVSRLEVEISNKMLTNNSLCKKMLTNNKTHFFRVRKDRPQVSYISNTWRIVRYTQFLQHLPSPMNVVPSHKIFRYMLNLHHLTISLVEKSLNPFKNKQINTQPLSPALPELGLTYLWT